MPARCVIRHPRPVTLCWCCGRHCWCRCLWWWWWWQWWCWCWCWWCWWCLWWWCWWCVGGGVGGGGGGGGGVGVGGALAAAVVIAPSVVSNVCARGPALCQDFSTPSTSERLRGPGDSTAPCLEYGAVDLFLTGNGVLLRGTASSIHSSTHLCLDRTHLISLGTAVFHRGPRDPRRPHGSPNLKFRTPSHPHFPKEVYVLLDQATLHAAAVVSPGPSP